MTSPETLEEIEGAVQTHTPPINRRFATGYMDTALFGAEAVVEQSVSDLIDYREQVADFDTLVATGHSGGVLVAWVAAILNVPYAIVRKNSDDCHHGATVMGYVGERWMFFDDFISSGATIIRVHRQMSTLKREWPNYEYVPTEFIGAYLYRDRRVKSLGYLSHRYTRVSDYLNGQ